MILLQIDFAYTGPNDAEMAAQLKGLAESINQEPGFQWKIWTEISAEGRAGGIYLFDTEENARHYAEMHQKRLAESGMASDFRILFCQANPSLSAINRAPL